MRATSKAEMILLAMADTLLTIPQGRIGRAERLLAVRALYDSIGARATVPFNDFRQALDGWDVIPVVDQHEIIGAVVRLGHEIHAGMTRRPHGAARGLLRRTLADTIAEHGAATTKVLKDNPAGRAFCERLGFELIGGDRDTWYMGCNKARHA